MGVAVGVGAGAALVGAQVVVELPLSVEGGVVAFLSGVDPPVGIEDSLGQTGGVTTVLLYWSTVGESIALATEAVLAGVTLPLFAMSARTTLAAPVTVGGRASPP